MLEPSCLDGTRVVARAVHFSRVVLCALAVAACGACAARPARHAVTIHAMAFDPARLHIAVGDTVEWTNHDLVPHTATARAGDWTSPLIQPGERWRTVFATGGRRAYYCQVHPNMTGEVDAGR